MSATTIAFDHLYLSESHRKLIAAACEGGTRVLLAPLDKGLSESSAWQARWELTSGAHTKLHVFKIGDKTKLAREEKAISSIASVLEPKFPHVKLYSNNGEALLRQEFVGNPSGETNSLRRYIQGLRDATPARECIMRLYFERMKHWHPPNTDHKHSEQLLKEALDWWIARADVNGAADAIGRVGLDASLVSRFGTPIDEIDARIRDVWGLKQSIPIGPVHGDLHLQNVIVDAPASNMELIDYGWTNQEKWKAIDFLMMECSLKFVASPPCARLEDLLRIDELLEEKAFGELSVDFSSLSRAMHGAELVAIAAAVSAVRHCAVKLKAVDDVMQYRTGLISLMAGLTSLPTLINRVFLFHDLAYHIQKILGAISGGSS
jgi:hypothetical protein